MKVLNLMKIYRPLGHAKTMKRSGLNGSAGYLLRVFMTEKQ